MNCPRQSADPVALDFRASSQVYRRHLHREPHFASLKATLRANPHGTLTDPGNRVQETAADSAARRIAQPPALSERWGFLYAPLTQSCDISVDLAFNRRIDRVGAAGYYFPARPQEAASDGPGAAGRSRSSGTLSAPNRKVQPDRGVARASPANRNLWPGGTVHPTAAGQE
jgi:hypothetical protein